MFLGGDFVTVTQEGGSDWQALRPQVLGAIMDHYLAGLPSLGASSIFDHLNQLTLLDLRWTFVTKTQKNEKTTNQL